MVDVGLNAFNVATGGTSKLAATAVKKEAKEGTKYLAGQTASKTAQGVAKKVVTDELKSPTEREYKDDGKYDYKLTQKNKG